MYCLQLHSLKRLSARGVDRPYHYNARYVADRAPFTAAEQSITVICPYARCHAPNGPPSDNGHKALCPLSLPPPQPYSFGNYRVAGWAATVVLSGKIAHDSKVHSHCLCAACNVVKTRCAFALYAALAFGSILSGCTMRSAFNMAFLTSDPSVWMAGAPSMM